jgi:hypothetical protein
MFLEPSLHIAVLLLQHQIVQHWKSSGTAAAAVAAVAAATVLKLYELASSVHHSHKRWCHTHA